MRKIEELITPSLDAADYNDNDKRDFFIKSYHQTQIAKKANKRNTYFIIGEKGTGKTALAYHIRYSPPENTKAEVYTIGDTQYRRFMILREKGKLNYTDYTTIWSSTLLYLVSKVIVSTKKWHHRFTSKFEVIENNLNKYHTSANNPELEVINEWVTTLTCEAEASLGIADTSLGIANSDVRKVTSRQTEIKSSLIECDRLLRDGIQSLKLKKDIVLFLDGIDTKPEGVSESEYKRCISGLAEATLELNKSFFSNIKDTHGRCKIVLLMRPDVINPISIGNTNCKLNDNAVFLDWETTTDRFENSDLFMVADKYFSKQNDNNEGWNKYFNKISNQNGKGFHYIINNTFQRPRDVFAALKIITEIHSKDGNANKYEFDKNIFHSSEFTEELSSYLLGEVRNYATYHFSNEDFDNYLIFFHYLKGSTSFSYNEFKKVYNLFLQDSRVSKIIHRELLSNCDDFLQFLYDTNIVCYIERTIDGSEPFRHYSYRDRSCSNLMPKVKIGVDYIVHYGLAKALNLGKKFK